MSACPAKGGEPPDSEPPITTLEEGEPAPFYGELFPPIKSIRLGLRVERCQEQAEIEIRHAKQIFENELRRAKEKADAQLDAERQRKEVWRKTAKQVGAWYRSPEFVAPVAVVATVGIIVLSVWAWGELSRAR